MCESVHFARVFDQKLVDRFPDTDFMTPAEVLEHRLMAIPGVIAAEVGPAMVVEGCEPYCTITIERVGYSKHTLDDVTALITGPQCCPAVHEPIDEDLLEAV